jgi:hypothetical protein
LAGLFIGMKEGDAGTHNKLRLGETAGKTAEGLDTEGRRDLIVVHRETDFFPGFAAGYLV